MHLRREVAKEIIGDLRMRIGESLFNRLIFAFQFVFTGIMAYVGLGDGIVGGFPRAPLEWNLPALFKAIGLKIPDWLLGVCFFNLALIAYEMRDDQGKTLVGLLTMTIGTICIFWVVSLLGKIFGITTLLLGLLETLLGLKFISIERA